MKANEKIFRHSFGKIVWTFLIALFLGYINFNLFALGERNYFLLLMAGYVFILAFLYATSNIRISNVGITTTRLWGSKTMGWSEIGRVSTHGQSIRLHNRDEDLILSIDSQLDDYKEIADIIFEKRPDLVDPRDKDMQSSSQFRGVLTIGVGVLFIVIGVFLFFIIDEWERLFSLFFFGLGLFLILGWLFSPRSVLLENDNLLVLYMYKKVSYSANEISDVSLEKVWTKNGYLYFVQLHLKSERKIKLPAFNDSALMYQTLKNWHENAISKGTIIL